MTIAEEFDTQNNVETEKVVSPNEEQNTVETIQNEDAPVQVEDKDDHQDAQTEEKKSEDKPTDPRAARLEEMAERSSQTRRSESEASKQAFEPAEVEADTQVEQADTATQEATDDDPMVTLKIRGKEVEMPLSEVKARAQKNEAADDYLSEARKVLDEARNIARTPQKDQGEEQATTEEKINPIMAAIEAIQMGEDPKKAYEALNAGIAEQAQEIANRTISNSEETRLSQRYDEDVNSGLAVATNDYAEVIADPISRAAVDSINVGLQRELITQFLTEKAPAPLQDAFAQGGITPQTLKNFTPQQVSQIYKDMNLRGHALTRPSAVYVTAAKLFSERYAGNTSAADTSKQQQDGEDAQLKVSTDRSGRKEAIRNPERTSINRNGSNRQPRPLTESERAAQSRKELAAERRKGKAVG